MTELKLQGQTRIDADRLWRSPDARKRFESETGLTEEMTEEYHTRFVEWALRELAAAHPHS